MAFKGFKSRLKKLALKNEIWIKKIHHQQGLIDFLSRFRKHYVSCDLIRVGGEGDGGYLQPKILESIKYCFSPGVSSTANFEKELSDNYGIKSFMADASVSQPPLIDSNFNFIPKFLASYSSKEFITLSDWLNSTIGSDEGAKILQMDIEGAEYDVLTFEDSDILSGFSIMTIEFHGLHAMFNKDFLHMISGIFEKIYKHFSICHVHPNNNCSVASLYDVEIPDVIEITFVRNDFLPLILNNSNVHLPHQLDRKNLKKNADIVMSKIWWDSTI